MMEAAASLHQAPEDTDTGTLQSGQSSEPDYEVPPTRLPWGAIKDRTEFPENIHINPHVKPGEFILQTVFAEFTVLTQKIITDVLNTTDKQKSFVRSLQRGEHPQFDQLLSSMGSMAEHCLPSLLQALFRWYSTQITSDEQAMTQDPKNKVRKSAEKDIRVEKRELAIEFIYCLVLIEVLKQLPFHPGHDKIIQQILDQAFRHFKYKEGIQGSSAIVNNNIIADLFAEVLGVLAQSRFSAVRKRFMCELKELRAKDQNPYVTNSIISLLMGMKFFRVKMHPIEEFQACIQLLTDLGHYFLDVKEKEIRHALAGLFVEILLPVAAVINNEVNIPVMKSFVEMLYTHTLDLSNKKKHSLALFPMVTCLLCVSQKTFFLNNWPYFLTNCLAHLKDKDTKMARVALESLYRLVWVYMIRVKCESNAATTSRLHSIVSSLFPKGYKMVVPRETPLNIFVKIIQFIAQERLDFAMREIINDLLCVGRFIKFLTPERMSIGLRSFLVIADSLQQKEGEPPMPQTMAVMPSGNTLRFKKTFINKFLSEETAKTIGVSGYYPHVRKAFNSILNLLDQQVGKPMLKTKTENSNKDPDEFITGERKPKIDLFRTCVAAVPRLLPDGMSSYELIDLLARLTVHMDDELGKLAFQSLQNIVADLPQWRNDILRGFVQFIQRDVIDTQSQLLEHCNRRLFSLITQWKSAAQNAQEKSTPQNTGVRTGAVLYHIGHRATFHELEGFALVMLCSCIPPVRKLAVVILREVRNLFNILNIPKDGDPCVLDVMDSACGTIIERVLPHLPLVERASLLSAPTVDFQWLADRTSIIWTSVGYHDLNENNNSTILASNFDSWIECMSIFMSQAYVVGQCTTAISSTWPLLYNRLKILYVQVDPNNAANDRASILGRPGNKKATNEKDPYMNLWVNYVVMGCCMAPARQPNEPRAASPDLSTSLETFERQEVRSLGSASAKDLFKILVPLIKCDIADMRETIVSGLGHINPEAFRDLVEELVPLIKEAIDRKQENLRRRKKRDVLRLSIVKIVRTMAENGIFAQSPSGVTEPGQSALSSTFVDYIDGARLYLESESDKDPQTVRDIRIHFSEFVTHLIRNTPVEKRTNFISKDLRHNLFYLFSAWSGKFNHTYGIFDRRTPKESISSELELSAIQSMSAVLCCGPVFDSSGLIEDGYIYTWLNILLKSYEEKVYKLAQETIVLLLEYNSEAVHLLDWVIDCCYTGTPEVADGCFSALAMVFNNREYPCAMVAMLNVILLHCGSPRVVIRETAVHLFHVLYKRFFMDPVVLPDVNDKEQERLQEEASDQVPRDKDALERATLQDQLISGPQCRSQLYISETLARLHPDLSMPIFSEITQRYETSTSNVHQMLLQYLLPWLHNMELVDPNLPVTNPLTNFLNRQQDSDYRKPPLKGEGWGSPQATEMVLNNLMFITAKFGEELCKEIESVWAALVQCWPGNLRVIVRYIVVVTGMAPTMLLPYTKRVIRYLARAKSERVVDELMNELQTTDPLTFNIERTQTPPFYRLTSLKKHSTTTTLDNEHHASESHFMDKGQIHTKRHSAEDPSKLIQAAVNEESCRSSTIKSDLTTCSSIPISMASTRMVEDSDFDDQSVNLSKPTTMESTSRQYHDLSVPYPLPMPAYGGYFAPFSSMLPDEKSLPNPPYQRCNLAVMLCTDLVLEGIKVDWTAHLPLMLHIVMLGADHSRVLIHEHCKRLLLNLLLMFSTHKDQFGTAKVLLRGRAGQTDGSLTLPNDMDNDFNFVDGDWHRDSLTLGTKAHQANAIPADDVMMLDSVDTIQTTDEVAKKLIEFLVTRRCRPLWRYEDISAKVHVIKSAQQIEHLLTYVLRIFRDMMPQAQIQRRWSQVALQLALSCSSRHYASRSFQILRALQVPLSSTMLSDILSRLVETAAEQGEDMQGYVTEIILTLQSAVDILNTDLKPLDFAKELFLSTPNLNKEARMELGRKSATVVMRTSPPHHFTSYSLSTVMRGSMAPSGGDSRDDNGAYKIKDMDSLPVEQRQVKALSMDSSNLPRSHSAQSLKQLQDPAGHDDKLTLLTQLFWIAVSLLESDYEHEFLLAVNLLDKVLKFVQPERPECREKLDKILQQINWRCFPGVQSLVLKGCTSTLTAEASWILLSRLTLCINAPVIDPTQCIGFPMNVIAILPYMVEHYAEPNQICIEAAEHISQICLDHSQKLNNLATVMTLYSRSTFGSTHFQWTKCVIKYLYDVYSNLSTSMIGFLVEVLDKGPLNSQTSVMEILYCILHYIDITASPMPSINSDLLRLIVKYIEGNQWKKALEILKLCVTRSSTLVAPPPSTSNVTDFVKGLQAHTSFAEAEIYSQKKELPGRTMDFKFDVSQIPVIPITDPRAVVQRREPSAIDTEGSSNTRSSINEIGSNGWKKPQLSQGRTRDRLVNLLITYGQRVGLPKSPSVIFSQSSDTIERQASMVSSSEDSASTDGLSCDRKFDDTSSVDQQLQVFRDFDFLDIELEYLENEGGDDKFNWGVKRHSVDLEDVEEVNMKDGCSANTSCKDESSDDEVTLYQVAGVSHSPIDEYPADLGSISTITLQNSMMSDQGHGNRRHSSTMSGSSQSIQSGLSDFDNIDLSPSVGRPNFATLSPTPSLDMVERLWKDHVQQVITDLTASHTNSTFLLFGRLLQTARHRLDTLSRQALHYLLRSDNVKQVAEQLSNCMDLIVSETQFPFVFADVEAMRACHIIERHKYTVLEINECFETYVLRRDQTSMCLDDLKTTIPLHGQGQEGAVDTCIDECKLNLSRCLYKQQFQFKVLYEGYCKLLNSLNIPARPTQILDLTEDVHRLHSEMLQTRYGDEVEKISNVTTFTRIDLEATAMDYLVTHNISKALQFVASSLNAFDGELFGLNPRDEIEMLLHIYCKHQSEAKPGMLVAPPVSRDLLAISATLMDIEISLAGITGVTGSVGGYDVQLTSSECDLSMTPPESSTL